MFEIVLILAIVFVLIITLVINYFTKDTENPWQEGLPPAHIQPYLIQKGVSVCPKTNQVIAVWRYDNNFIGNERCLNEPR